MMMEHRNAIGSSSAEVAQRRVVESYRDFSTITEQDARNLQGTGDMLGIFDHAAASSVHVFPEKMHYILLELENEGSRDIVSWLPHGRAFMVHSLKLFEEEILSKWFNMTKYTSFQRQMNLYGFRRVAKGVDKGAYYHELFLKGRQYLCKYIKRTKIKGASARKCNPDGDDPNFYRMPPVPPPEPLALRTTGRRVSVSSVGSNNDVGLAESNAHSNETGRFQSFVESRMGQMGLPSHSLMVAQNLYGPPLLFNWTSDPMRTESQIDAAASIQCWSNARYPPRDSRQENAVPWGRVPAFVGSHSTQQQA
jgi:hypothetical protein